MSTSPHGAGLAGPCVLAFAAVACGPPPGTPCPNVVDVGGRFLDTAAVVVARDGEGVRAEGFDGAARTGSIVYVGEASASPDDRGRFSLYLEGDPAPGAGIVDEDGTVSVRIVSGPEEETFRWRVRDLESALACIPGPPVATGTVPNHVSLGDCDGRLLALVPASGDGAVDVLPLDGTTWEATSSYFPPPEGRVGSAPWAVAPLGDGRAVVTLQGTGEVALFLPCTGTVVRSTPALDVQSMPVMLPVDPPVELREPRDVNGDGVVDETVLDMRPTGPQAVVASPDRTRVYVAYTNVLESAANGSPPSPMTAGPGLVVAFTVAAATLLPAGTAVLPAKNPQGLAVDDRGALWVSATGIYTYVDGALAAASDGALYRLDPSTLDIEHTIDMGRFAPGTPTVVGDRVVVGSTLSAEVVVLFRNAGRLDDGQRLSLVSGVGAAQSVFEALPLPGGLVGLTWFDADTLRVLDPTGPTLDPWPFSVSGGVRLAPPGDDAALIRGLLSAELDPRGVGAGLLNLSAELVPLDLRRVFGP